MKRKHFLKRKKDRKKDTGNEIDKSIDRQNINLKMGLILTKRKKQRKQAT